MLVFLSAAALAALAAHPGSHGPAAEAQAVQAPATESPAPEASGPEASGPEAATPEAADPEAIVLESSVPWWEKITVTVDAKGKQQACRYETSLSATGAEACDDAMAASVQADVKGNTGSFSKVTFERRFSPGGKPDSGQLHPGDTLLGRQVMYLTLNADGSIETCKVVAVAGDSAPDYDCDEAKKEQFRAQAGARQAFMTILAYGHSEQIA